MKIISAGERERGGGGREGRELPLGGATSENKPASLLLGARLVVVWRLETAGGGCERRKWQCLIFDDCLHFSLD